MGKQPKGPLVRRIACLILSLVVVLSYSEVHAGSPGFSWVKTARGNGAEVSYDLAVDRYGYFSVAGYFNSTNLTFDSITISNTVRTGNVPMDCFVALFNSNGVVQWARSFGGTGDDRAFCVAVDAQGYRYVAGSFGSTNFTIGNITLTNAVNGNSTFFVAKLHPAGFPIWARCPNKNFSSSASGLAVDASNNVYVAGSITGTNIIAGTNFVCGSKSDVLLLKYDSAGNLAWGQHLGGPNADSGRELAVDDAGNIYLSATFLGTNVVFGEFLLTTASNEMAQNSDIAIVKFDSNGTVQWAKGFGGELSEVGRGIAVDAQQNCYIAGDYQSTAFSIGDFVLTNAGFADDVFVAKLNTNGIPLWAKSGHGDFSESAWKIAVDQSGNSYIGGYFQSPRMMLDNVTFTNFATNTFSDSDAFIAKFDTEGNIVWTSQVSAENEQRIFSLGLSSNAVYATGWTQGTNVYFGYHSTTNSYLDLFITKLPLDLPQLRYAFTNDNGAAMVKLSWTTAPDGAFDFPEYSNDLQAWRGLESGGWGLVDDQWTVTVPVTNQTFFRLQRY